MDINLLVPLGSKKWKPPARKPQPLGPHPVATRRAALDDDSPSPQRRRRRSTNATGGALGLLAVIVAFAFTFLFLLWDRNVPTPPRTDAPVNAPRPAQTGAPASTAAPAAPARRSTVFFVPLLGEDELTPEFDLDKVKGLSCMYTGYVQALVHFDDGTTAPASKGFNLKGETVRFSGPEEKELLIECRPR